VSFCVLCIFIFKAIFETFSNVHAWARRSPSRVVRNHLFHPSARVLCLISLDTWFSPDNPHQFIVLCLIEPMMVCECVCVHIIRELWTVGKCAAEQLVNSTHLAALAKHYLHSSTLQRRCSLFALSWRTVGGAVNYISGDPAGDHFLSRLWQTTRQRRYPFFWPTQRSSFIFLSPWPACELELEYFW
jgi:hypothetical protein